VGRFGAYTLKRLSADGTIMHGARTEAQKLPAVPLVVVPLVEGKGKPATVRELAAAHDKDVLHCDLKPANVMLDGRGQVRITDFGLARLADQLGCEGNAGTPPYMAPEQLAGEKATERSDIYTLGPLMY